MVSRACPKVGIYFSHYECFGHTSRVMAVGDVFKKRFPKGNLFFIQAGVHQPKAAIGQLGPVYSLPGAFMGRGNFRKPTPGAGTDADTRGKICVDIVTKERPGLFITEFFPLGWEECRYELIPALLKASAQGSTLFGVAGYPFLTGTSHGWREKIIKLYQQIIIFAPSSEKEFMVRSFTRTQDRQRYIEFFKRNAQKIIFAGYLLPQQKVVSDDKDGNIPVPPVPKGACRVTVVRGGGAVYPKVIAEAILASDRLGKEYYLTVVAGPSTTSAEWDLFTALMEKKKINNVVLRRSVGNYEELIKDSDVCVSMASYHTSVMLLKHRKKVVVIPFEGYGAMSFGEQPARATMLKEMIGAKILSIKSLTAERLAALIKEVAAGKKVSSRIPKEWFLGAAVFDQSLTRLFLR